MSFTSYENDFHDVTLWRTLGQRASGQYIDATAGDGTLGMAFREQGWRGVHAGEHGAASPVVLDALFDACAPGPVHWLRLNACDLDADALAGWQNGLVRPWIIVVSNAAPAPGPWQADLATRHYVLAGRTDDTLFYAQQGTPAPQLRLEHLPQARGNSPLQLALYATQQRLVRAEQQAALANGRAETLQREAVAASTCIQQVVALEQHLQAVLASTSWRVTGPMRWVVRLRRTPGAAVRELLAACSRKPMAMVRRTLRAVLRQPAVRRLARKLAARYPGLAAQLRARYQDNTAETVTPVTAVPAPSNPANLLGPGFRTLLLTDLAEFSHAPPHRGKT